MEKDFDGWNIKKKSINQRLEADFLVAGEIWWCSIGVNVGHEQDGKHSSYERPVLILKHIGPGLCWIIPITSTKGRGEYVYELTFSNKDNALLLAQIRIVSTKRLNRKVGSIALESLGRIRRRLAELFLR